MLYSADKLTRWKNKPPEKTKSANHESHKEQKDK